MAIDKKNRSDKERIKNITNKVHPEEQTDAARASSTEAGRRAAERKRAEERRKRIRRKRRRRQLLRFACIVFVVFALVMTVRMVKTFHTGARYDQKGITAYENGDYQTAVRQFKEALSYDGQNADYYIHLGMAYIEQKAYNEALGYFNQAEVCAEDDEQQALLYRGRGIAYLYQGNYTDAAAAFENALMVISNNNDLKQDILYYKAEAEEKSGDYQSAVASYGEIIRINDDAGARMLRGLAYVELEDYAQAETDLYAAVEKSRKSYAIYRALYSALVAQGKTDEAVGVLQDALGLSGSSGEDYFNRGMIYIDLGDTDSALQMLDTSYDKGYAAALLGMGEVALSQEDYEKARSYYEQYFDEANLSSEDDALLAKGYNQYAICLIAAGDYEQAAAACQSGLNFNDREADKTLTWNLMIAYENLFQWENAYNTAKSFAERYPDDAQGQREYQFLESRVTAY